MRFASILATISWCVCISCSASVTEWSGTINCGELQNSPNSTEKQGFVGRETLRIDGNKAVLDRTMKIGVEHLEGVRTKGNHLQLEGKGWRYSSVDRPWKVRATLTEIQSSYEGSAILESIDGLIHFRDCRINLTLSGDAHIEQVAVQASMTNRSTKVFDKLETDDLTKPSPSIIKSNGKQTTPASTISSAKVTEKSNEISKSPEQDRDYSVVRLVPPTDKELALIKRSSANEFLTDGATVKTANIDLDGDGTLEVVVVASSSQFCGSEGCASKVLKIETDGSVNSFDNDCPYFGETDQFGVGKAKTSQYTNLYPLSAAGGRIDINGQGSSNMGKPSVCKISSIAQPLSSVVIPPTAAPTVSLEVQSVSVSDIASIQGHGTAKSYAGAGDSIFNYMKWGIFGILMTVLLPLMLLMTGGRIDMEHLTFLQLQDIFNKTGKIDTLGARSEANIIVLVMVIGMLTAGPLVLWFGVGRPILKSIKDDADTVICCIESPRISKDAAFAVDLFEDESILPIRMFRAIFGENANNTWILRLIDLKKGEFVDLTTVGASNFDRRTLKFSRPRGESPTAMFLGDRLEISGKSYDGELNVLISSIQANTLGYAFFPDDRVNSGIPLWVSNDGKSEYSDDLFSYKKEVEIKNSSGLVKSVKLPLDDVRVSQGGRQSSLLVAFTKNTGTLDFFYPTGQLDFIDINTGQIVRHGNMFGIESRIESSDDGSMHVFRSGDFLKVYRINNLK